MKRTFVVVVGTNDAIKLAWCSYSSNFIRVYDSHLASPLKTFVGAKISNTDETLIEHIPNTNFVISSNSFQQNTNFEVYDVETAKSLFSYGSTTGSKLLSRF